MTFDNCEYCGGKVREHKVRVDHRWKGLLIVVEKVPVGVCAACGERYYSATVMRQLDRIAQGRVGSVREIKVPVADFTRAIAA